MLLSKEAPHPTHPGRSLVMTACKLLYFWCGVVLHVGALRCRLLNCCYVDTVDQKGQCRAGNGLICGNHLLTRADVNIAEEPQRLGQSIGP
jgi:hypothetical protein